MPDREQGRPILLSIHLQSNRPRNFLAFLDNIEQSATDPAAIEVVVKIDDTDVEMNRLLEQEIARRRVKLRYISTPLPEGFYGLWRSINETFAIADKSAYFFVNLNDEMRFLTADWDGKLRGYIGLFADDIFRLRTSGQRHRNYYDFWEAGFANDTSAIMTRRWIELGGNWCPCNGPDSFQECVAYYFGWNRRFDSLRPLRDIAIDSISFDFAGGMVGLNDSEKRSRMRGALLPWWRLMSHQMQEEASRRAEKLRAHIWAHEQQPNSFEIRDNRRTRRVDIIDVAEGRNVAQFPYGLSLFRITAANFLRLFNFGFYGGAGEKVRRQRLRNFVGYLLLRFDRRDKARVLIRRALTWMRT